MLHECVKGYLEIWYRPGQIKDRYRSKPLVFVWVHESSVYYGEMRDKV